MKRIHFRLKLNLYFKDSSFPIFFFTHANLPDDERGRVFTLDDKNVTINKMNGTAVKQ